MLLRYSANIPAFSIVLGCFVLTACLAPQPITPPVYRAATLIRSFSETLNKVLHSSRNIIENIRPTGLRALKLAVKVLLPVLVPIVLYLVLFFIKTGQFPSLSASTRQLQIARTYFPRGTEIVMKQVNLHGSGTTSYVTFPKDEFFKRIFVYSKIDEAMCYTDICPENKVVIIDSIDLGILKPFSTWLFPFKKVYEIKPLPERSEFSRLYDVTVLDVDGDDKDEILIQWLDYAGGSGGTSHALVVSKDDGRFVETDLFPALLHFSQKHQEANGADSQSLAMPELDFRINNKIVTKSTSFFHTDVYFEFADLDKDGQKELVVAIPGDDCDYHYGPQGWSIIVLKFSGKQFVPDPNFRVLSIPKSTKWGIPEVHGITFVPLFGQLFYTWKPSWLNLPSEEDALVKPRKKSVVIDELLKSAS